LLPSATYGLYVALRAVGAGLGDEVVIPAADWPSSLSAVLACGAMPVFAPVDDAMTIAIDHVAGLISPKTKAVVASHIHGVAADVPGLLEATGGSIPIIEDCAQALGSTLDGSQVGTLGDIAVFSFGPDKSVDVGEAGMIVTRTRKLFEDVVRLAGHPTRQIIEGIEAPTLTGLSIRPHPQAARQLVFELAGFDATLLRERHANGARYLTGTGWAGVLGFNQRRSNASAEIPVLLKQQVDSEMLELLTSLRAKKGRMMDIAAVATGAGYSQQSATEHEVWLIPTDSIPKES
jgi:dTDP-4-amino-4,6-dideoxygalactose transaminase